jgi:hypothetical protein
VPLSPHPIIVFSISLPPLAAAGVAVFGEAVRVVGRHSTWRQTGPVSIAGSNASAGVFVAHGATWLQESHAAINISALQQHDGSAGVRLVGGVWQQHSSASIELTCQNDDYASRASNDCNNDSSNKWGPRQCSVACTGTEPAHSLQCL